MEIPARLAAGFGLLFGLCAGGVLLAAAETPARDGRAAEASAESADSSRQRPAEAGRRTRIRHGGLTVGGGYLHRSGGFPYYGYPYSWGYYDPFFPAFYHPGYWGGFVRGAGMGQVKLNVADKLAEVYLDDGYAGTAGDLKSIWLEPGAYNLELRDTEGQSFQRRIYVLSGKTVRVTPSFTPSDGELPDQYREETP